jgi:translation initiation factor 1
VSRRRDGTTVYSSEHGRICPHCGLPTKKCMCRANPRGAPVPTGDGIVRVRREKKGRGGKTVTTATGIPLTGQELSDMAKALRRRCGSGGTLKEGVVEIQGDHVETVMSELTDAGFEVKRSGG